VNLELTSGQIYQDQLIIDDMQIEQKAIQQGTYLKGLSDLETVAFLLTQLAQGYEKKFGKMDDFTDKCANLSILHYPPNAVAYMLKSNHMASRCQEIQKTGKTTEELKQKPLVSGKVFDDIVVKFSVNEIF
jgi:hypothetical protein